MENTNFVNLAADNFTIRFFDDSNKLEVIFHEESTKFFQPEAYETIGYANAITALMLDNYPVQADGVWLSQKIDKETLELSLKNDNLGYAMGWAVRKMLAEKVLTYRKANELEDTNLYRIAYDGWNTAFVRNVEHLEADALEADYLTHNRNAWRTVQSLQMMRKIRAMGMNLRLTYFERMAPYFTGENGFRVKVGMFNLGKIDDLRTLVNRQIADAMAGKSLYKEGKRNEKAKAEAAEEGVELTVTVTKPFAGLGGVSYKAEDLIGKNVQLFTGGESPMNRIVAVTADVDNLKEGKVSIVTLSKTVGNQGLKVAVVNDEPKKSGGSRKARRNEPEQVS